MLRIKPVALRMRWSLFCLRHLGILVGTEKWRLRSRAIVFGSSLVSLRGITRPRTQGLISSPGSCSNIVRVHVVCLNPDAPRRLNTLELIREFELLRQDGLTVDFHFPDRFGHLAIEADNCDCLVVLYDVLELRTTPWWHTFVVDLLALSRRLSPIHTAVIVQDDYTASDLVDQLLCCLHRPILYTGAAKQAGIIFPRFTRKGGQVIACLTAYAPRKQTGPYDGGAPDLSTRTWDIGTRVRRLSGVFGTRGLQKAIQAENVARYAERVGMSTNVSTSPQATLLGTDWTDFLSKCRAVPSTSGGASIVDRTGLVTSFGSLWEANGRKWTPALLGLILSRTIFFCDVPGFSPRLFEAAQAGCILFLDPESELLGLEPDEDFVPLTDDVEKSLMSLKRVLADPDRSARMINRAYSHLFLSGEFDLRMFVRSVVSSEQRDSE